MHRANVHTAYINQSINQINQINKINIKINSNENQNQFKSNQLNSTQSQVKSVSQSTKQLNNHQNCLVSDLDTINV